MNTFAEALVEVRKAQRLLHVFQRRMIDLVIYIKQYYNAESCNPKTALCNGLPNDLDSSIWAWDFISTFACNYYMKLKGDFNLSLIQITDTGFLSCGNCRREYDEDGFEETQDSLSLFVFWVSTAPPNRKDLYLYLKSLNLQELKPLEQNNCCIYPFLIEDFEDEEKTNRSLELFDEFCKQNGKTIRAYKY